MRSFMEFLSDKWWMFPLMAFAGQWAGGWRRAGERTAYKRARRELDGLIVLPDVTPAALEGKIAPELDAGPRPAQFHQG
ncbi:MULTISPECIES: hypothetical protein [Micrococcaceae]|uniref:hypothetical protein n=1 Tax=Micrococcaceae TaxID=1268 RepID=UPI0012F0DE9B|nr:MULTISPECIES: hypothetical protein [unclassified Arthrobacter]BCW78525.1 hypothetical protein NicSoilC5_05440 [Arthrobacter sp. NicSoilC5]VXB50197.1 hypothetical protein ARTHRO8AJ_270022 [Arthrobacter sp. 8AJ]